MANRRNRTKSANKLQETAKTIPEVALESEPIAKRHVWSGIKFFAEKGVDTALENVWAVIGGGVMALLTALAIYVWSGQAEWLYPFLKYAIVFFCGMFSLIIFILLLTFVKIRKENALEKAKNEKFISDEKGLLDHRVDYEQAQRDFPKVLGGIGRELSRISQETSRAGARLEFWDKISLSFSRRSISKTAARLRIYSKGLEQRLIELVSVIAVMNESVSFLLTNGGINKDSFDAVRLSLIDLIDKTQSSYASLEVFRDAQIGVIGISQDLNTAINRLISVTNGNLGALKQAEETWKRLIGIIDEIKNQTMQLDS